MADHDKNELIQSLMRLRKRYCGGVSGACMTTNNRMVEDNTEFQKIIQGVKSLITERDAAQREVCEMIARTRRKAGIRGSTVGLDRVAPEAIAAERGWDCYAQEGEGMNRDII